MKYKMCKIHWIKKRKRRVTGLMTGRWSYEWVCPKCHPIRLIRKLR